MCARAPPPRLRLAEGLVAPGVPLACSRLPPARCTRVTRSCGRSKAGRCCLRLRSTSPTWPRIDHRHASWCTQPRASSTAGQVRTKRLSHLHCLTETVFGGSLSCSEGLAAECFKFGWRDVAEGLVEAVVVVSGDPFDDRELELCACAAWFASRRSGDHRSVRPAHPGPNGRLAVYASSTASDALMRIAWSGVPSSRFARNASS